MGTHPIFESDFDCLTDLIRLKKCISPSKARASTLRTPTRSFLSSLRSPTPLSMAASSSPDSPSRSTVLPKASRSRRSHECLVVKSTVLLPELVRSRDRPQRSTPRRRRRPRLDELSDECSPTDDSSTSSHPSARRRAPTRTLNRALSNNLHLQQNVTLKHLPISTFTKL